MNSLSIGNTITIKELLKYGPLGLELEYNGCLSSVTTKVLYDLEFYNSCDRYDRNCSEAVFLRHFPDLLFIPGFILHYSNGRKELVMDAWGRLQERTKISKLPKLKLLKRKEIRCLH